MPKQFLTRLSFLLLLPFSICILTFLGCDNKDTGHPDDPRTAIEINPYEGEFPIPSTVTVGMVADLLRVIGGEHFESEQLMGPGVDPHLYTATRDDAAAILSAKLVLYNGLMLEGKMSEVLKSSPQRPAIPVGELLPRSSLQYDPDSKNHPDPHVWMDANLWRLAALSLTEKLCIFDPEHSTEYVNNAAQLESKLTLLHEYGKVIMAGVPTGQRVLVTSHDAFRYFGRAYGLDVQAVQGISTESEAGLKRINELVKMLVEKKVAAVFIESSVSKESIESLLEGASQQGHEVVIGGQLYSDAMGEAGTYEGTYIGMMDHNLTTIAKALGSKTVPEGGFEEYFNSQINAVSPVSAEAENSQQQTAPKE